MSEVKNSEISELNKAIFTLLYDQFDCPDVMPGDYDDTFVEFIINALVDKNGSTCPYKNYSCEPYCKDRAQNCENGGLDINCGRGQEDVWRDFINIGENKGEWKVK